MKNVRDEKNILHIEELEVAEELDDASFSIGFAAGVILVAGAAVLVLT